MSDTRLIWDIYLIGILIHSIMGIKGAYLIEYTKVHI